MTKQTNTPIIKKLKKLLTITKPYIKWGVAGAFILFLMQVFGFFESCQIKTSYKDSILHEIQVARNLLDYTLAQHSVKVTNRVTFPLLHESNIASSFASDPQLKIEITDLYLSLSSAKTSALELITLTMKNNSNPTTINNRVNDIKRAISFADKVGPKLAKHLDKKWVVPPPNMSPKELIKYFEKTVVIYSAATAEQVKFK